MPGVNTRGGRRSTALSSPTTSTHPPPSAPLPKIKLKLRGTPTPTSTPPPSIPPPSRKTKDKPKNEVRRSRQSSPVVGTRTRRSHADQRGIPSASASGSGSGSAVPASGSPHVVGLSIDDSDSDLTPEDEEQDEDEPAGDVPGGVDLELEATPRKHEERPSGSATRVSAAGKEKNVGTSGPGGRERKRAVKIEERERRRARDAKFAMGDDQYPGSEASEDDTPSRRTAHRSPPFRALSRRSRSHSRHRSSSRHSLSSHGLGHESEPDLAEGLPEAFAGQEIEDLHYGAGPAEIEMQREVISGWWDGEEDDEMFISQLSGSEAERQSQSSVASDSDDPMSGSDDGSTSDDGVDEFGFPLPSQDLGNTSDQGPLVLMENWDGQFVLVQPRQERSRSRRHGSRGSRTAGSVGASTTFSVGTGAEGGLIIDPDAMDQDQSSESEWSGLSDESEGGDTTDSMAEEDMPMLDSPALDQLIGEQMANVSMGVAIKTGSSATPSSATSLVGPSVLGGPETPSIVITDMSEPTAPPALLDGSIPTPIIETGSEAPLPLPSAPMMGTFHPTTSHPAQHAVIDGSKTPTKSPFTHRRRSRKSNSVRGRSDSFPSIVSRDERERKRKSLQFDADHFAVPDLPKRLRYSSIPGHPRYIAAQRASDIEMEMEDTPSEDESGRAEDMLDLEDMLEESILSPMDDVADDSFRFDRVPVSRYLKRHFGTAKRGMGRGGHGHGHTHTNGHSHHSHGSSHPHGRAWSLPSPRPGMPDSHPMGAGMGLGMGSIGGLDHTLAGPVGRMMLLSPGLAPVHEDRALSRKEKRRKKRRAVGGGQDIPELSI